MLLPELEPVNKNLKVSQPAKHITAPLTIFNFSKIPNKDVDDEYDDIMMIYDANELKLTGIRNQSKVHVICYIIYL